jgi:hypothetical protein
MTAEEIRNNFGWNAVAHLGESGFPDSDLRQLMRYQIMALGELAAQLAELTTQKGEQSNG